MGKHRWRSVLRYKEQAYADTNGSYRCEKCDAWSVVNVNCDHLWHTYCRRENTEPCPIDDDE